MITLYPHQRQALNAMSDKNNVMIEGYEGLYEVDVYGNVYSILRTTSRRKLILKPHIKNGYLAVNLYKDGKCKHHYIHRLVARAFLPNPHNLPEVNHKNCNKHDNRVVNLERCNRKQNLQHSYDNGLNRTGSKHGCHKLTEKEVIQIKTSSISQKELALKYRVSQSTISAIKTGRLWKEVI